MSISIHIKEALDKLKAVNAPVFINDEGLLQTGKENGKFVRIRIFKCSDSLGSLVCKNKIDEEVRYWRNR